MRKYDRYKDSGIEWIGEIPNHWDSSRYRYFYFSNMGVTLLKEDVKEDGIFPVYSATETDVLFGYVDEASVILNEGDIVIPARGNSIGHIKVVASPSTSTQTTIYSKKISQNIETKFVKYFLQGLREHLFQFDRTAIPQITVNQVKNNPLVIPTPEEQIAIADYLDRKTSEMDELIADKKRLLELYEEEKTAIINQAVTKGINPDLPMKDSGIEWLGEIPEHWEVKKIGHCGKIVRGGSPRPTGDPRYFFGDYIHWITVKEVTNAVGKYVVGTEEYLTEEGSKNSRIIEPETLLLSNSGATLGVPKISKIRGCINDGSVAFPELKSFLDRDYLYYFFVSHTDIYREQMAGNGQPNLNTEIIKSTFIPVPSTVQEQTAIVDFIESETQKVIAKKSKTEKLIELLTEYRTALISDVVTGKVKVID
ncbi:type I restriction enzyme, S subunit [Algoriphagus alkaliphilus]|uniref:Type I restriction enzyme, S subunit n=1 Tax=Algoriphagus alkaliphilus TaxID=279824 RepID=A0A1G5V2C0_9BACT|nr:restriction endonuclease subunit S [Algoriphagus alkaliphilus]SDA39768.1 type I restriction enzyme, S subunit [Algoriphagus alkaliphilus]